MLKETFHSLIGKHSGNLDLREQLLDEICRSYSAESRHYHTLSHLSHMLQVLEEVKTEIKDWVTLLFALFYHDIIYKPTSSKNEEESAALARLRLEEIGYPQDGIAKCCNMISATRGHAATGDNDTNHFTDADLSVLGQTWELYAAYAKGVRKEYVIYPDLLYKPGRKKVLRHFLKMNPIFKTSYFFEKYEVQAKENLSKELETLNG